MHYIIASKVIGISHYIISFIFELLMLISYAFMATKIMQLILCSKSNFNLLAIIALSYLNIKK